ncbi:MAG: hypothetical protein C0608_11575 [Deltaproteobacteria bacterium]|nr:MAG: hypothetical protein C0608_11575 [Deltaproteobacteria bacterium]
MIEVLRKAMLAGIGALTLTEAKARSIVDELVEHGKLSKEEGEGLVEELLAKAAVSRKELEQKTTEFLKEGLKKMDLVMRSEFDELKARVALLEEKLTKEK